MRRFPHLRRLTAVVTHLLLLQLAFASAAGACPLGERGARHDGMQMGGASSRSGDQHAVSVGMQSAHVLMSLASQHAGSSHCDMSCTTTSCAGTGHCSVDATLARAGGDRGWEIEESSAAVRAAAAPRSVSRAPEPPPPRA